MIKIIGEIGINHNGDIGIAKDLINVAVDADADAGAGATRKWSALASFRRRGRRSDFMVANNQPAPQNWCLEELIGGHRVQPGHNNFDPKLETFADPLPLLP